MEQKKAIVGVPVLGIAKPVKNKQHVYGIKKLGIIGRLYQAQCPECGSSMVISHKDNQPLKTKCYRCQAIIVSRGVTAEEYKALKEKAAAKRALSEEKANKETPTPAPAPKTEKEAKDTKKAKEETTKTPTQKLHLQKGLEGNAKLVWGGFFSRKKYVLRAGETIIGRRDDELPSDLMLDDEYVSRQSIKIEKRKVAKGYFYKLTVLRVANPVLVNGQELQPGDNVYLNFGDTIVMGYNTVLTFKSE